MIYDDDIKYEINKKVIKIIDYLIWLRIKKFRSNKRP